MMNHIKIDAEVLVPGQISEAHTRHVVILGVPVVIVAGGIVAFKVGGYGLAAIVLGVLTAAMVIMAWLFRPRWWGTTRVKATSITVLGALAMVLFADIWWLPMLEI